MAPKRIYAVRHGESEWNVLRTRNCSEEVRYSSVLYLPDCAITDLGVQQGRDAGAKLSNLLATRNQEDSNDSSMLLVVSPLRRALQTADEMIAGGLTRPEKTIVQPLATEILYDSCDIGSAASNLQRDFPSYNFTDLPEYWWWPYGRNPEETYKRMSENLEREPESHILDRIQKLKDFLNSVPESVVVMVCHSETIWWLTSCEKEGSRHGEWTENGEILDVTAFVCPSSTPNL